MFPVEWSPKWCLRQVHQAAGWWSTRVHSVSNDRTSGATLRTCCTSTGRNPLARATQRYARSTFSGSKRATGITGSNNKIIGSLFFLVTANGFGHHSHKALVIRAAEWDTIHRYLCGCQPFTRNFKNPWCSSKVELHKKSVLRFHLWGKLTEMIDFCCWWRKKYTAEMMAGQWWLARQKKLTTRMMGRKWWARHLQRLFFGPLWSIILAGALCTVSLMSKKWTFLDT